MTKKYSAWLGIVLVLVLGGTAYGWRYHANHSEEALIARANQYWEAIRLNDLHTAYNMEAETVGGTLLPDEVEIRREWGMRLVEFKLGDLSIYGDKAEISVTTTMTMAEFDGHTFPGGVITDYWTFMKGKWYHGTPEKGGALVRRPPDPFERRAISGSSTPAAE